MKNTNLGLTDNKLHCPECGDVVFTKVAGKSAVACTNCGHQLNK
ncbi:hypothetical protein [Levilactobacillus enshiensis]|nr:hypothetical protein [Levilactobacillus enshiensis]